jgi:uncharacterized protein YjbI with pentapeptide repeats
VAKTAAKRTGDRAKPARHFALPDLADFDGDALGIGRDYDSVLFTGLDFTGQDVPDARFLECRLDRCCVDRLSLRRVRFIGCQLTGFFGASVDFADSTWRDSELVGGRLGAVTLAGTTWKDVRVHGTKLGFLNLAGARLEDVVFEECEIGSLDVGAAQLKSVSFTDCSIEEMTVAEATLSRVDLSHARLRTIVGVDNLRGAVVSHQQLLDLAPQLAAQIGIEVRQDQEEPPGSARA